MKAIKKHIEQSGQETLDFGLLGFITVHEAKQEQDKAPVNEPNRPTEASNLKKKRSGGPTDTLTLNLFEDLFVPPTPTPAPAADLDFSNSIPLHSAAGRELAKKKRAEELAKPTVGLMRTMVSSDGKVRKKPLSNLIDKGTQDAIKAAEFFDPFASLVRARMANRTQQDNDQEATITAGAETTEKPRF